MKTTKLGRPTENVKDTMLRVRLDNDTLNKLDSCVKIKNSNRSEVVRESIKTVYDNIKK
ncbi:MAG: CopG family transcriptional regulator [Clostridia bacterium]|nr:CopG family transcriptional regulator [Clostridia bacterium]